MMSGVNIAVKMVNHPMNSIAAEYSFFLNICASKAAPIDPPAPTTPATDPVLGPSTYGTIPKQHPIDI
jgi:hypothetical protein